MSEGEKMELTHEPVPGYRGVFHVVLGVALIYLVVIFVFF